MEIEEPAAPQQDEDDDSPYIVAGGEIPTCPRCRKEMAPGAVLCTGCGFDTRTRKKAVRTYETIDRSWDADMKAETRLTFLAGGMVAHAVIGTYFMTQGASVSAFVRCGIAASTSCWRRSSSPRLANPAGSFGTSVVTFSSDCRAMTSWLVCMAASPV